MPPPASEGVERLLDLQHRPTQPRVRGTDQVPQRLRERPLPAYRDVDRPRWHRRDTLERGRPGALERGPGRAQAIRIFGAPVGAAGKVAVELSLDERDHVDAIDAQELAVHEPRRVDVRPLHLDPAHHDAGQVSPDEPGATQVRVDELRSPQIVGLGEGCHDFSSLGDPGETEVVHAVGTKFLGPSQSSPNCMGCDRTTQHSLPGHLSHPSADGREIHRQQANEAEPAV